MQLWLQDKAKLDAIQTPSADQHHWQPGRMAWRWTGSTSRLCNTAQGTLGPPHISQAPMCKTCIKTQHLETLSSGFPTATVERGERSWFLKGEKLLPYLWTRNLHLCNLWSRHWNKTANIQCRNIWIWFRVQLSLSAVMLPTCLNCKGLHSLGCALHTLSRCWSQRSFPGCKAGPSSHTSAPLQIPLKDKETAHNYLQIFSSNM